VTTKSKVVTRNKLNHPKVIAISGASGSGKTTIIKKLGEKFDCPFLLFDDHTNKDTYPTDMKAWFKGGANVSHIKTPALASSLAELLSITRRPYVFIEEPFGKERDTISSFIDYVILLDQPLELCLARIIKRHLDTPSSNTLDSISGFVNKYEEYLRDIYKCCVTQVKSNCDLIIDEVSSIEETSNMICDWLNTITEK